MYAQFDLLALDVCRDALALAARHYQFRASPQAQEFLDAYAAAGGVPERLPQGLLVKRAAIIRKRRVACGWIPSRTDEFDRPGPAHLEAIAWGYSPTPDQVLEWLQDEQDHVS